MKILVTGGAGFIGSNFIRYILEKHPEDYIVNYDALTYAGNLNNLKDVEENPSYLFIKGNICDAETVNHVMEKHSIDTVIHFAAESHVDRSIDDAPSFVRTNVLGTGVLLDAALKKNIKHFIHVSTDEVYGSILENSFSESDNLNPSSPYSASKAGSDLLASAYYTTFNLPVIITRCTNNFGPYQYPEKLIPRFVTNLLRGQKIPVYGTGQNVRDWLYVYDHCSAIDFILRHGSIGEVYNIGGGNEWSNLEITEKILEVLEEDPSMIEFVRDRLGHDLRYSLNTTKINSLGWRPVYTFEEALLETIRWYVENESWWRPLIQ